MARPYTSGEPFLGIRKRSGRAAFVQVALFGAFLNSARLCILIASG